MTTSSDDSDLCAVCLERACSVAAEGSFLLPLVTKYNYVMLVSFFPYLLPLLRLSSFLGRMFGGCKLYDNKPDLDHIHCKLTTAIFLYFQDAGMSFV